MGLVYSDNMPSFFVVKSDSGTAGLSSGIFCIRKIRKQDNELRVGEILWLAQKTPYSFFFLTHVITNFIIAVFN